MCEESVFVYVYILYVCMYVCITLVALITVSIVCYVRVWQILEKQELKWRGRVELLLETKQHDDSLVSVCVQGYQGLCKGYQGLSGFILETKTYRQYVSQCIYIYSNPNNPSNPSGCINLIALITLITLITLIAPDNDNPDKPDSHDNPDKPDNFMNIYIHSYDNFRWIC